MPWIVDAVSTQPDSALTAPPPSTLRKPRARRATRAPSTVEVVQGLAQVQKAQHALERLRERIALDSHPSSAPVVERLADCLVWQQEVGQLLESMQRSGDMSLQARNAELEKQMLAAIRAQQVLVSCVEEATDEVNPRS
jgi:hypothetical protein